MPRRSNLRITGRTVSALRANVKEKVFWDQHLPGFGVRVHATGRKVYVVQTRGPNGQKRVSIGRHGDVSAANARKKAALIIDRIKLGENPVDSPPVREHTVMELAERYWHVYVNVNCKARTVELYRGALRNHILPAVGSMPIGAVGRADAAALHHQLRSTPSMANNVILILSKMFSLAATWGLLPAGRNPCRSIRRYSIRFRDRYLTQQEYRRLGRALCEVEADGSIWPPAIAAIRLLVLTGCRRDEVLTLRWEDVDRTTRELRLRYSKTGPRMVPLTTVVEKVLACIPRQPGNPWVIVGRKPNTRLSHLRYYWCRVRTRAEIQDVRIHDLRHSYASRALAGGESLTMIGRLLGHAQVTTTARYAHVMQDSEKTAAARVGDSIGAHFTPWNTSVA